MSSVVGWSLFGGSFLDCCSLLFVYFLWFDVCRVLRGSVLFVVCYWCVCFVVCLLFVVCCVLGMCSVCNVCWMLSVVRWLVSVV